MSNRLSLMAAICASAALGAAGSASATTYMFSFTGDAANTDYGTVKINGTFTTAAPLTASGALITGITGTVADGNQAKIVDGNIQGLSPYASADNILYNTGVNMADNYSFSGVSFYVTKGVQRADYNLFGWNGSTNLLVSTVDSVGYPQSGTPAATPIVTANNVSITNSVTAVPEPSTWAMMFLGLFGLGAVLRRRSGSQAALAV